MKSTTHMSKGRSLISISVVLLFTFAFVVPAMAQHMELLSAKRLAPGGVGVEISTICGFTVGPPPVPIPCPAPSAAGGGGKIIDSEIVTTAADTNVILVTVSATGDSHNGAQTDLGCKVDGALCETILEVVPATPTGWVAVQRYFDPDTTLTAGFAGDGGGGPADWHDNNINQTWCVAIEPTLDNTHTVVLKLGASTVFATTGVASAKIVFLDNVKVYIEGAHVSPENAANGGACGVKTVLP